LAIFMVGHAKDWKLEVKAGGYDRKDCALSVDLSDYQPLNPKAYVLYEVENGQQKKVASQFLPTANGFSLVWILAGTLPAGTTRQYLLKEEKSTSATLAMAVEDTHKVLILKKKGNPILSYNYVLSTLPKGVDPIYKRSGYIHPIYSPKGNVLTNINPKDHRHHYGLWNPWTHLVYDGKLYDLWNLVKRQGTVRSEEVDQAYQGNVMAGFKAHLGHYIFNDKAEKKIMDEWWTVKTWNVPEGNLWDFESALLPSTPLPVLIKEYRYAGFGFRATADWKKENCEMMTSEGYDRSETDGTRARWIYITGTCKGGRSGLLFLGSPTNFNAPQPLRIWKSEMNNGRGDAFINFAPTKDRDWKLEFTKKQTLRYRVFVYDGEMTPKRAEAYWSDYVYPPTIIIVK